MPDTETSPQPDDPIAVAEKKTQKRGTLLLYIGLGLIAAATVIPTRMIVYAPGHLYNDPVRLTGTILNVVTVLGAAFVCVSFGLAERLQRSNRAAYQQQIREQTARLERIEQAIAAVPDFAEGVILGTEARKRFVPPAG